MISLPKIKIQQLLTSNIVSHESSTQTLSPGGLRQKAGKLPRYEDANTKSDYERAEESGEEGLNDNESAKDVTSRL